MYPELNVLVIDAASIKKALCSSNLGFLNDMQICTLKFN